MAATPPGQGSPDVAADAANHSVPLFKSVHSSSVAGWSVVHMYTERIYADLWVFFSSQPSQTRLGWRSWPSWRKRGNGWFRTRPQAGERGHTGKEQFPVNPVHVNGLLLLHPAASRSPGRTWGNSETMQNSTTSPPSKKLPCRSEKLEMMHGSMWPCDLVLLSRTALIPASFHSMLTHIRRASSSLRTPRLETSSSPSFHAWNLSHDARLPLL